MRGIMGSVCVMRLNCLAPPHLFCFIHYFADYFNKCNGKHCGDDIVDSNGAKRKGHHVGRVVASAEGNEYPHRLT